MKGTKICLVEGCSNNAHTLGYCKRHYDQMRRYGKIVNSGQRSMFDMNEIIEHDDHAEIILYDKYGNETNRTLIDLDDVDKIKNIKWCYHNGDGYVDSTKVGSMHRFIMNCPKDMVVDHINRDRLDNRKTNLRICTIQQNAINRGLVSNNTSGFTGVSYDDHGKKKWRTIFTINGKVIRKRFCYKSDAIRYRLVLEIFYSIDKYITHYQLLESVLQNNLEYTLNDLFNTESLEQVQEYINILFTDSVLKSLELIE